MSFVTKIIGGVQARSAAGKAADAQVAAAQQAGETVTNAAAEGNKGIAAATTDAQGNVISAGKTAIEGVNTAAGTAAENVNAAAAAANARLDPYAAAGATAVGELDRGLVAGGDFNRTPTAADLQIDPGYDFRLKQGLQAIQRSAAAHGAVGGGGALRAITDYAQGSASQEYQNAFNRFEKSTQDRFDRLFGVSRTGQAAASEQGQNTGQAAVYGGNVKIGAAQYGGNIGVGTNEYAGTLGVQSADTQAANTNAAARYAGDRQVDAGNARAAGFIGKANAWNSILSGVGDAVDPFGGLTNAASRYVGGFFKRRGGGSDLGGEYGTGD